MMPKPFDGYPSFEDWLDAVRVQLYEETKHMTDEERRAYVHADVDPIVEEFGLKYCSPALAEA